MTRAPAPFAVGRAAAPELPAWLDWLAPWLGWLFALGIVSLLLTIVLVPVVVVRLPADHFAATRAARPARNAVAWLGHVAKNAIGVVLVLAGIAMLVLPGQGILTLLVGLLLLDFPGKRRLELALLRRPPVRAFLDRIRTRRGCEPFRLEPATPARGGTAPTPVLRHALTAALVLAVAAYFWLRWPSWQALSAAIDYMPLQQDFVGHYHPMGRQLLREPVPVPGYFYPSFFALLLVPFGQLDVDTASVLWGALQLALVLALGWLVLRAGLPRTVTGAALALCLVSTSTPVLHNLKWGQVSVLLTLCALVALWPRPHERQRLRGAVLGFATAVKVYPGLFAVLWLARRNVRALVAFVATAALCTVVIPALVLGPAGWWRFERAVVSAIRSIDVAANLNSQSFANVVARWDYLCTGAATGASAHLVLRVVGGLLGIAGLLLAAGLDRRCSAPGRATPESAAAPPPLLGLVAAFLALPFLIETSWPHYFVHLPWCQVALLAHVAGSTGRAAFAVRVLVAASIALASVFSLDLTGHWSTYFGYGALFVANALLVAALGVGMRLPASARAA